MKFLFKTYWNSQMSCTMSKYNAVKQKLKIKFIMIISSTSFIIFDVAFIIAFLLLMLLNASLYTMYVFLNWPNMLSLTSNNSGSGVISIPQLSAQLISPFFWLVDWLCFFPINVMVMVLTIFEDVNIECLEYKPDFDIDLPHLTKTAKTKNNSFDLNFL